MIDRIIQEIETRARTEFGGDLSKAASEYFRAHPDEWQRYKDEVTVVSKHTGEDRERINATVQYRIEMVACRDKLNLDNPADRVAVQAKVFAEDPALYKRYRAANSVRIGTVR